MIGISLYLFLKNFDAFALAVLHAITITLQFLFIKKLDISSHLFIISSSVLSPYGLFFESLT